MTKTEQLNWIAPNLANHWQLAKKRDSEQFILKAHTSSQYLILSPPEAYGLRYFNGQYTLSQIQSWVQRKYRGIDPNLIHQLLDKLIHAGILSLESDSPSPSKSPQLKLTVEWRYNPDGYWVLRNREDWTYMQLSDRHKTLIEQLSSASSVAHSPELKDLLQKLTLTGMLAGTTPPQPPKRKFNPLQLLFFKLPLLNPDAWLTCHVHRLSWIWTRFFTLLLGGFLGWSLVLGLNQKAEFVYQGQQLLKVYGSTLFIPFGVLVVSVVTLHELGHAFTLKHYGGDVPEVGLLFMCLFPAAYTDTTDSYCLPRWQRIGVVLAGVVVQVEGRLHPEYVRSRLNLATTPPLQEQKLLDALKLLQLDPLIENIQAELAGSPQLGQNVLEVRVVTANPWVGEVFGDNARSPSVGSFRRGATVGHRNLSGWGDRLNVSYSNTDGSDSWDFAYMVPVSPHNTTISLSAGAAASTIIEPPFVPLNIDSTSRYYQVTVRHPVVQTPTQELALSVGTSLTEGETSLLDFPFPLSPGADVTGKTRITALRLIQESTQQSRQHILALRSQFSLGLDALDATVNSTPPDTNFFAWRGQAQWVRLLGESTLIVRGNL